MNMPARAQMQRWYRRSPQRETKSWEQADYAGKGGWATMPASTAQANRQVAAACAEALEKLVL